MKWAFNNGNFHNLLSDDKFKFDLGSLSGITEAAAQGYSFFYSGGSVKTLLRALAQKSLVNVIASPSLMVLNNQEAYLNVGDDVPTATGQLTNPVGGSTTGAVTSAVTSTIAPVKTGIILTITPRVNSGGLVIMDVKQEANKAVVTTTSKLDSPTIQTRKITSSVAIRSGDTIVLGGLIRDDVDESVSGVPFLSSLPLIGPLFGTTTRNHSKTELVVLITPRVVESSKMAKDVTEEFKRKLVDIYEDYHPVKKLGWFN
jgi:general secretion pathway protein D